MDTETYRCEVSIVGVDLPSVLDVADFYSAVSYSSFAESNAGVLSTRPHSFSVQGELGGRLLHITLRPCEPSGPVKLELETFLALPCVEQSDTTIELGMVPCGSGASARAISRHCAPPGQVAEGAASVLGVQSAVLHLVVSITQLSYPSDVNGASSSVRETLLDSSRGAVDSDRLSSTSSPVAGKPRSQPEDVDRIAAELDDVRTELQVQQTLLGFQEKRLQACETSGGNPEIANAEALKATVRTQQDELQKLRREMRERQSAQEHVMWQVQLRFQAEIDVRDQRVGKLQEELREKDRQIERMSNSDVIWRMPSTGMEQTSVIQKRVSVDKSPRAHVVFQSDASRRCSEYSIGTTVE